MPGRLNRRSIFDPRFTESLAFTFEKSFVCTVQLRRAKPGADTSWDYELGKRPDASAFDKLWEGQGRVQPNKDWRARGYTFGDETTVFHAVRIQIPLVGGEWFTTDHEFRDEDQALVLASGFTDLERIEDFIYLVRNPLMSGNAALQNLLCDIDLKGGISRGDS